MKKLLLMLIAAFAVQVSNAEAREAYDKVLKSGEIQCGYGVWDPYLTYNFETEKPEGVVIDIMQSVADKLNLKLAFPEETGWANMPTALTSGRIDVACSTFWNDPARGRRIGFTEPVFYNALHAYVRADDETVFNSVEDMNKPELKISTMDGSYTDELAKRVTPKAKHMALPSMSSDTDLLLQVANGKADIVFYNASSVDKFNKNNPKKLKRIPFDEPVTVYGASFAVNIHEEALRQMLNTAVLNLIQTGEIEDITREFREKYPGEIILPVKPYRGK